MSLGTVKYSRDFPITKHIVENANYLEPESRVALGYFGVMDYVLFFARKLVSSLHQSTHTAIFFGSAERNQNISSYV